MKGNELEIKKLIKKEKRLSKRIDKLDKKAAVLEWLSSKCDFNKTTQGVTLAACIGLGTMVISLFLLGLAPVLASWLMVAPLLGLPCVEMIGEWFIYPHLQDAFEIKSYELGEKKQEILKHIEELSKENESFEVTEVDESSEIIEIGNMISDLCAKIQTKREEERAKMMEKAKSLGIDVDRISRGRNSFSSNKDAKEDLNNFFEENNIVL